MFPSSRSIDDGEAGYKSTHHFSRLQSTQNEWILSKAWRMWWLHASNLSICHVCLGIKLPGKTIFDFTVSLGYSTGIRFAGGTLLLLIFSLIPRTTARSSPVISVCGFLCAGNISYRLSKEENISLEV